MRAAALVVGALLIVALLWIGGELHYIGCVDSAEDRHPPLIVTTTRESTGDRRQSRREDLNADQRRRSVDGCSRLPF